MTDGRVPAFIVLPSKYPTPSRPSSSYDRSVSAKAWAVRKPGVFHNGACSRPPPPNCVRWSTELCGSKKRSSARRLRTGWCRPVGLPVEWYCAFSARAGDEYKLSALLAPPWLFRLPLRPVPVCVSSRQPADTTLSTSSALRGLPSALRRLSRLMPLRRAMRLRCSSSLLSRTSNEVSFSVSGFCFGVVLTLTRLVSSLLELGAGMEDACCPSSSVGADP